MYEQVELNNNNTFIVRSSTTPWAHTASYINLKHNILYTCNTQHSPTNTIYVSKVLHKATAHTHTHTHLSLIHI